MSAASCVVLAVLVLAVLVGAPGARRALWAFLARRGGSAPPEVRDDVSPAPAPARWGEGISEDERPPG